MNMPQEITVHEQAQIFLDLSQEYLELVPVLDSQLLKLSFSDSESKRFIKRILVVHASLIRKFITRGEVTYVGALYSKILNELKGDMSPGARRILNSALHQELTSELHRNLFTIEGVELVGREGEVLNHSEGLYNLLYGRLLHADYKKWANIEGKSWGGAYLQAVLSLRGARTLLMEVRSDLIMLSQEGVLQGLEYDASIWVDHYTGRGEFIESRLHEHRDSWG